MPELTILYWRDIPAQVIVGKGRRAKKRVLTPRFEQAIDRCAMKVARGSDPARGRSRHAGRSRGGRRPRRAAQAVGLNGPALPR
ncbi:virulence factor [Rhodovulum sp.]|uniref:virulence factor n=1 Tax=Rhodovulum sp. TaxID=34009 RepID=UPI0018041CA1|nr:virulence factor [Rhodovulum sp.]HDR28035.1 hypothetical protein [Rhodovulum sp.]